MINYNERLHDLTDISSPAETLAEIKNILLLIDPSPDPTPLENVYTDIISMILILRGQISKRMIISLLRAAFANILSPYT